MKDRSKIAARTACLLGVATVLSGPTPAIAEQSLKDALRLAFETNPTIQAERARQRATSEARAQAWAAALPQITGTASYSEVDTESTFAQPVNPSDPQIPFPTSAQFSPLTAQADGSLVVFNGLRNVNTIRQARSRVKAGGAQLAATEQDVLLRTATAFFDVSRDSEVYAVNLNNLKVLSRQREEAALRFKVGDVTRTDVAQSEARLAGARAEVAASQAALAISRAGLAELTGETPQTLEDDPAKPDTPDNLNAAQSLARAYAPGVIAAKANEIASRRGIALAKGAFSPEVSLTSQYQYSEDTNAFTTQDEQFSYGVRATVPIFLGGLNISRVREARALNDADRRRVLEAERRAEAAVTAAWEQWMAAKATIASATAAVDANELALKGVRREAELGARTTLDVLNAEQELLGSTVSLANAERDARVAAFSILSSAGLLTIDAASGDARLEDAENVVRETR